VFELEKQILDDSHEAILTLHIEEEQERRALRETARRLSREINVPGFRKGKVPPHVLMRVAGEEWVLGEVVKDLLEDTYAEVLEQAGIEAYGSAILENVTRSPMSVTLRVPLAPEVELGDYHSVRLPPEPVEVTEEEVAEALERLRDDHAILEPVQRPAEAGDALLLSLFEGQSDGEMLVHEHDLEVALDPQAGFIAPGVVEALIGLQAGDEKTFVVTLPEDYETPALRGREVSFTAEVAQVYERTLPDLDDVLANAVGNYETLEELKAALREQLLAYKEEEATQKRRDKLVAAFMDIATIRYPPSLVADQAQETFEEIQAAVRRKPGLTWEDFLLQQGVSEEELRAVLQHNAEKVIQEKLLLTEFARHFGFDAGEEEIREEFAASLREKGIEDPALVAALKIDSETGQSVRSSVITRKVLERLERIAQGLSPEEAEPEPEAVEV